MVFIICAWHAERGGTEARTLIFDRVQSLNEIVLTPTVTIANVPILFTGDGSNRVVAVIGSDIGGASIYVIEGTTIIDTITLDRTPKDAIILPDGSIYLAMPQAQVIRLIPRSYSFISGRVHDGSNNPIPSVNVSASGGVSAITDANGYYTITNIITGTYTLTPTLTGYTFSPPTRTVSVPPDVAGQDFVGTPTPRIPIVFIPGVPGSRLFNTVNGQEQEVWADVDKIASVKPVIESCLLDGIHPLMVLRLAADGMSPACNDPDFTSVRTKPGISGVVTGVTGSAWGFPVNEVFYETLINRFIEMHGYRENTDFWVYPYDWRKDLRTSADGLDMLIQNILTQTGASQVYIVAHSGGGLVTRRYISNPTRATRVKHAVILGTPFLGTPKAFYGLLEGDCMFDVEVMILGQDNPKREIYCFPKKQVIKALVPNFPLYYQIMPSEAYFTVKGGGFYGIGSNIDVTGMCPTCLSFDRTYTTSIASNINLALSTDARQFHSALDNLTTWNGVPVTIIGGTNNMKTIAGILQRPRVSWKGINIGTVREPKFSLEGDGTVTLLSVSMANPKTGQNLRGSASFCKVDVSNATDGHIELVRKPEVLDYVDGVLGLGPTKPCPSASGQSAANVAVAAQSAAGSTGAQIIAYGVSAIHSYDSLENHTGPITGTEFIEQAIPGSGYFTDDQDMATVALIGGRTYTVTITPSGVGPVDFTLVRSTITETLTSTLYLGISVTAQSRITLVGDPFAVDTWQLDVTGNGMNTQPISPTSVFTSGMSIDSIPPTTTITLEGTLGPNGWYTSPVTVTLTATDNITGTGISRIEYAFSNDRQPRIYSAPFAVNPEQVGMLYAIAVDLAGNTQLSFSQARIGPEKIYLPLVMK